MEYGISMEYQRFIYDLSTEYLWNMEYLWNIKGLSMIYLWNLFGMSRYTLCMWVKHGKTMSSTTHLGIVYTTYKNGDLGDLL